MAQALEEQVGGQASRPSLFTYSVVFFLNPSLSFTDLPKTTELQALDEDEASSPPDKPSALGQCEAAAKKEDKMRRKRKSSGSPNAEAKKKRVADRPPNSNNRSTRARVPDTNSLHRFRDYPENDDLEFITHGPTIDEVERAATGGSDREVNPSMARELERKPVVMASREATPAPMEATRVIDIIGSRSQMESLFDDAQAIKEKPNEMSRAANEASTYFMRVWTWAHWRITPGSVTWGSQK